MNVSLDPQHEQRPETQSQWHDKQGALWIYPAVEVHLLCKGVLTNVSVPVLAQWIECSIVMPMTSVRPRVSIQYEHVNWNVGSGRKVLTFISPYDSHLPYVDLELPIAFGTMRTFLKMK